jgi:Fe-S oxidoreductase
MNQICCGGGGGTLVNGYNQERVFYGRRKMDQIRATGAGMLVVTASLTASRKRMAWRISK